MRPYPRTLVQSYEIRLFDREPRDGTHRRGSGRATPESCRVRRSHRQHARRNRPDVEPRGHVIASVPRRCRQCSPHSRARRSGTTCKRRSRLTWHPRRRAQPEDRRAGCGIRCRARRPPCAAGSRDECARQRHQVQPSWFRFVSNEHQTKASWRLPIKVRESRSSIASAFFTASFV
jgi:hypothetical protein